MLEDRLSSVRGEWGDRGQEERAAGSSHLSSPPVFGLDCCAARLLAKTLVLLPEQSDQVGLWTPFAGKLRIQESLRQQKQWVGIGGVMEKQRHQEQDRSSYKT